MFGHVVQGFLEREEQIVSHVGRQGPRRKFDGDVQPATNARGRQEVLGEFLQIADQTFQRVVAGVHRPDDLVHRPRQLVRRIVNLVQAGGRPCGVVEIAAGRFA